VELLQIRLVRVALDTRRKLNHITKLANHLNNQYSHWTLTDPAFTLTELGISRCKLDNNHHKILDAHALKTAQLHCLSMDLISLEAIKEIFDATDNRAAQNWMSLLIHNPSDLFQVEASYYINPNSTKPFIPIPMALTESLLRLLKFPLFLLPFIDTHLLLQDLDNSLLSLSSGS